jgi:hypothetical protein
MVMLLVATVEIKDGFAMSGVMTMDTKELGSLVGKQVEVLPAIPHAGTVPVGVTVVVALVALVPPATLASPTAIAVIKRCHLRLRWKRFFQKPLKQFKKNNYLLSLFVGEHVVCAVLSVSVNL